MTDESSTPPGKGKSRGLVVGLAVLLVGLGLAGWWLYGRLGGRGGSVSIDYGKGQPAAVAGLRTEIPNQEAVDQLLVQWGLADQETWELPGGLSLTGKVTSIKVITTTEPQPYNREDTANGPVGSVNVEIDSGVMTIIIQSSPLVWSEIDKSWHVESQLLRVLNDFSPREKKLPPYEIIGQYEKAPRLVVVYEK